MNCLVGKSHAGSQVLVDDLAHWCRSIWELEEMCFVSGCLCEMGDEQVALCRFSASVEPLNRDKTSSHCVCVGSVWC